MAATNIEHILVQSQGWAIKQKHRAKAVKKHHTVESMTPTQKKNKLLLTECTS